ncbi:P-type DNA transfer ATPase VirB11 [Bordetella genomosp. 12]|uniref:Type IV secretion system protein n=1 Tax=Bordetella genomosp. 12 TaxID=463035 RepID=A0A261VB22_9BORD|nr:P-type DNA transfer ATPase VirB11 [Bordetella genomosp. 12]OZI71356.1 P-type DNA transfer ATPase VirB11 [Bordetella genomosp. 12]
MSSNPSIDPIPFDRAIAVRTFLRPLSQHLDDPNVTEIAIVRAGELYTRVRGAWLLHDCPALTYPHLEALATALAAYNHMARSPIQSVILPDGERGQIVQPPACIDGTLAINIRKHAQVALSLEELLAQGAFTATQDADAGYSAAGLSPTDQTLMSLKADGDLPGFLHEAVLARKNLVITGATGSGKTTFARSLIDRVPVDERLVTIEDVHELILSRHRNRVHLMYGGARGRVSATESLAACMRLSPDRIFLAELRGPETWDYLAALNTGHPGSVTTTHANGAADAFDRLAMLIKQSPTGGNLDLPTIQAFLRQTVDIVLHFERFRLKELWFEPRRQTSA